MFSNQIILNKTTEIKLRDKSFGFHHQMYGQFLRMTLLLKPQIWRNTYDKDPLLNFP